MRREQSASAIAGDGRVGQVLEPADHAPRAVLEILDGDHPIRGTREEAMTVREHVKVSQARPARQVPACTCLPQVPDPNPVVDMFAHDAIAVRAKPDTFDHAAGSFAQFSVRKIVLVACHQVAILNLATADVDGAAVIGRKCQSGEARSFGPELT